jgi:hypothetical protein
VEASRVDIGDGHPIGTELYALRHDPHELRNALGSASQRPARRRLLRALRRLDSCEGSACVEPF